MTSLPWCKNTSLRLKHSDCVLRLCRDNKNLSSKEYSENLKTYLGSARKTTISVNELSHVISKITRIKKPASDNEEMPSTESFLKPGEHVAVYWVEEANTVYGTLA